MSNKIQTLIFTVVCLLCIPLGVYLGQHYNGSLHTRQCEALGVTVLFGAQGEEADAALDVAEKEIARLDALFRYDGEGDIARLNAEKTITAEEDTVTLLTQAKAISAETDGLYSCTLAPLLDAWGITTDAPRVPSADERQALLAHVGDEQIDIDGQTVTIPPEVRVNVNGIARGYIADRVREIFADYALDRGFISLGVDSARYASGEANYLDAPAIATFAQGAENASDTWTITFPNPVRTELNEAEYLATDQAIFTQAIYLDAFEINGERYLPLIDPRSGLPVSNRLASLTVVSDDGPLAAALSEALYVMGRDDAIAFWREHAEDFDIIFMNNVSKEHPVVDGSDITITAGINRQDGAFFSLLAYMGREEPIPVTERPIVVWRNR